MKLPTVSLRQRHAPYGQCAKCGTPFTQRSRRLAHPWSPTDKPTQIVHYCPSCCWCAR